MGLHLGRFSYLTGITKIFQFLSLGSAIYSSGVNKLEHSLFMA